MNDLIFKLIGILFVGLNCIIIYDLTRLNRLIEKDWHKLFFVVIGLELLLYVGIIIEICGVDNIGIIVTLLIIISWIIAYKIMSIYRLRYDFSYIFSPTTKVILTKDISPMFKKGRLAILGSIEYKNKNFTVWSFDKNIIKDFGKKENYNVKITEVISSWNPTIVVSQVPK